MVSLVLVRRYSAHATASHAQDCPDCGPEIYMYMYLYVYVSLLYKHVCFRMQWLWLPVSGRALLSRSVAYFVLYKMSKV